MMTIGVYLVIVQQIEQADASACFRIILCMIKNIGQQHSSFTGSKEGSTYFCLGYQFFVYPFKITFSFEEHNHDKGIPLSAYRKQLSNLLQVVRFVGRKVTLPPQTWEHLRALLLKLEKSTVSSLFVCFASNMRLTLSILYIYYILLNNNI